jgi:hypothetical protein
LGVVEAAEASVRFSLTDRDGVSALDTGRASFGPGYDYLRSVVEEMVGGQTGHAGALLAPLGVRYVVADGGDLPAAAAVRLGMQVDLDRMPAGGLTIYRNAASLPTAFVASDPAWTPAPADADLAAIASRPIVDVRRLPSPETGQPTRVEAAGEVVASDQFGDGWRLETAGTQVEPRRAFGWAMAAEVEPGSLAFAFTRQWPATAQVVLLGLLWLVALWITRKPGSA